MIFLVFDTETTGLPKHPDSKPEVQPKVIEFAAALIDEEGAEIDSINVLINPGEPLEAIITKITGLTDEDLADQDDFATVALVIRSFFERADVMIAHNLPFDSNLIQLELGRLGITEWPWPRDGICTVQEFAEAWGRRPKLTEFYQEFVGEKLAQTHRALDDVRALVEACKQSGVLHAIASTPRPN